MWNQHIVIWTNQSVGCLHENDRLLGHFQAGLSRMISIVETNTNDLLWFKNWCTYPQISFTKLRELAIPNGVTKSIKPTIGKKVRVKISSHRSCIEYRRRVVVEHSWYLAATFSYTNKFHTSATTLPGFMRPIGSTACFMARIRATASGPSSRRR